MADRVPWECPRCHKMIAPHVDEHECGPDGGVGAEVPAPQPTQPPATVSMSHPWQWWSTTTSGTGSAVTFTFPSAKILAQEVMREMHRYDQRTAGHRVVARGGHGAAGSSPSGGGGGGASGFLAAPVIVSGGGVGGQGPWGDSDAAA